MILEHYSKRPLGKLTCVEQRYPESYFDKPRGLWVSVKGEDDWYSWCHSEGFHLDRLAHCTRIILKPDANVLIVDTPEAITALEDKYGFEHHLAIAVWENRLQRLAINWPKVAEDYQGIIIAPYDFNARWDKHWYYSWDCASGCIWDTTCIAI